MRSLWPAAFAAILLLGAALPAGARSPRYRKWLSRLRQVPDRTSSISWGTAIRGRLLNGRLLEESEHVRYRSGGPDLRWGTDELVVALSRAATHVARVLPGAQLSVGDISRRRGGRFRPHRSHRSGRDVDLAFYMLDSENQPAYHHRFVRFRGDGTARRKEPPYIFDDARNWELVTALLSDPLILVQHMFVSRRIARRLLVEGHRRGASDDLLERARLVLTQPSRGGRHNDHFHVRVYCAENDRPACVDRLPHHPWYTGPPPRRRRVQHRPPALKSHETRAFTDGRYLGRVLF